MVQNLLHDIGQIGLPFDSVDAELVAKPQPHPQGRESVPRGPPKRDA